MRNRPMLSSTSLNNSPRCFLFLRCSSNDKRLSSIIHRSFYDAVWLTVLLLKVKAGWEPLLNFRLKIRSWACLLESRSKFIFHCCAQWVILAKLLLSSVDELSALCNTKKTKYYQQIIWYQTIIHQLNICVYQKKQRSQYRTCVNISPCRNLSV